MKIQSSKTNRKTNKNKISDMQDMISSSKQNPRASLLRERKIYTLKFPLITPLSFLVLYRPPLPFFPLNYTLCMWTKTELHEDLSLNV